MTLSSDVLLAAAAQRIRTARPELDGRLDVSSPQALRAALAAAGPGGPAAGSADSPAPPGPADPDGAAAAALAVCVVGRFSLPDWVRETCRFALAVPAERAQPWRRAFTRTVYLAGRPEALRERFAFTHLAPDGSAAWSGPGPEADTSALRRLLKAFDGRAELGARPPVTVRIPAPASSPATAGRTGPATDHVPAGEPGSAGACGRPLRDRITGPGPAPAHRDLWIATAGVTVTRALVHLNHLLAEAVLDRLVVPGDRVTLRCVPRLTGLAASIAVLRVDADLHRPSELQAFAALTERQP